MTNLSKDSNYFLSLQTETGWGRILQSFAKWCAPSKDSLIMDVGCGPGMLSQSFDKMECTSIGVDLDIAMFVPTLLYPKVVVGSVYDLPFEKNTFDMVTATNVVFLVPQPFVALQKLADLVKPHGELVLLNPSEKMNIPAATELVEQAALTGLSKDTMLNYGRRAEKYYAWSPEDLSKMFREVGLEMVDTDTRMGKGLVRYAKAIKK
jgi:ubiquinone/menaquinone biosynthesis C-methylase UbiE